MTSATLLRSRVKGNFQARFCSRVGVATPRLRQRPGESRGFSRLGEYVQRWVRWVGVGLHEGATKQTIGEDQ